MQTILGAGGIIGTELAKFLPEYTNMVRLVARNPKPVMGQEELFSANLLDLESCERAVEGSEVVYLCIGLPYQIDIWQRQWPVIMDNVIAACTKHRTKLVFFDNIYMYHPKEVAHLTEKSSKDPQSQKGKVRKEILAKLWEAHHKGEITATVARSADFYGPNAGQVSVLNEGALKPLLAGKTANWFGSLHKKHSFTYTIDAAKATAILGNSPLSWGEEWHLPTDPKSLTGQEFVNHLAALIGTKPKVRVASAFILKVLGLFNATLKEFPEMLYQYQNDYFFDSSKFEKEFDFKVTPYKEGLASLLKTKA
jgi:nucleoside-diphosphate-sugar epimerase